MLVKDKVTGRILIEGNLLDFIALDLLYSVLSGLELDSKHRIGRTIHTNDIESLNASCVSILILECLRIHLDEITRNILRRKIKLQMCWELRSIFV